ncbi:MAG: ammonia monooxygenase [Patescibacteria group bacterium]|nr:ammonia monooxygenase [Patescibacteria group bacterium]
MSSEEPENKNVVDDVRNSDDTLHGHAIFCPACGSVHIFDNRWTYNGNPMKPTFRASMLVESTYGPEHIKRRCHSFVTDGQIQFLDDCTHELKGKTVPLEPFHW